MLKKENIKDDWREKRTQEINKILKNSVPIPFKQKGKGYTVVKVFFHKIYWSKFLNHICITVVVKPSFTIDKFIALKVKGVDGQGKVICEFKVFPKASIYAHNIKSGSSGELIGELNIFTKDIDNLKYLEFNNILFYDSTTNNSKKPENLF